MYHLSNHGNDVDVDVDVEVHSDKTSYCVGFDTYTSRDSKSQTRRNMSKYGIKHNNQDRALTKDGVVIAQLVNGVLTISPGAVEWVTDWDMIRINAFIRTNGCMRRTKEQIMEMSDTGENLLA